jgi:hypothetical protein
VKQRRADYNYEIQHELGRLDSSQIYIYKDLMGKMLEDEMMDKFAGHLKICLCELQN